MHYVFEGPCPPDAILFALGRVGFSLFRTRFRDEKSSARERGRAKSGGVKKGTTNTPQESGRSRRFVGKVDWGYRIAGDGFDFIGEGLIFLGRGRGHAFQFNFCRVAAGKAFTSISACQRSSSDRWIYSLFERDAGEPRSTAKRSSDTDDR